MMVIYLVSTYRYLHSQLFSAYRCFKKNIVQGYTKIVCWHVYWVWQPRSPAPLTQVMLHFQTPEMTCLTQLA